MLTGAESQSAWNIWLTYVVMFAFQFGLLSPLPWLCLQGQSTSRNTSSGDAAIDRGRRSQRERIEAALSLRERRLAISPPGVDHLQFGAIAIAGDLFLRRLGVGDTPDRLAGDSCARIVIRRLQICGESGLNHWNRAQGLDRDFKDGGQKLRLVVRSDGLGGGFEKQISMAVNGPPSLAADRAGAGGGLPKVVAGSEAGACGPAGIQRRRLTQHKGQCGSCRQGDMLADRGSCDARGRAYMTAEVAEHGADRARCLRLGILRSSGNSRGVACDRDRLAVDCQGGKLRGIA